jgi:hypothetical protein
MTIPASLDIAINKLAVATLVKKDVITNAISEKRYERKIAKSQKKLAETTLVPGVVQIYA